MVILDLSIPKLGGLEVLERYRRERDGAPVVVFTSSTNSNERVRAMELGVKEYLVKPIDLDDYISTIRRVIERWMGETSANGI